MTRWVTHLCAPTFALLAGLGVGLRRLRGATPGDVSWFLFTRGLWLVVLELTLFRVIIWFNVDLHVPGVPAGDLGHRRVDDRAERARAAAAAPRSRRSPAVILIGHNALDGIRVPFWFPGSDVPRAGRRRRVVDAPAPVRLLPGRRPGRPDRLRPLSAAAVDRAASPPATCMAAIYALAGRAPSPDRSALTAVAMLAAFVVLRTFNIYGDPHDWAPQPTLVQSAMAFMNVKKYPPSLSYVLVTLVPALLAAGGARRRGPSRAASGARS